MINFFHYTKIFHNLQVLSNYVAKAYHQYPSQPLEYIATYSTLLFWYLFMLVHREKLDSCLPSL
jgi:hypothetical protein